MKNFFLILVKWLNQQFEWMKSFLNEEQNEAGEKKGSMKRLASLLIVITFMYTFITMFAKTLQYLYKDANPTFPDIPSGWMIMLGAIIGLNIISNYMKDKNQISKIVAKREEDCKEEQKIKEEK